MIILIGHKLSQQSDVAYSQQVELQSNLRQLETQIQIPNSIDAIQNSISAVTGALVLAAEQTQITANRLPAELRFAEAQRAKQLRDLGSSLQEAATSIKKSTESSKEHNLHLAMKIAELTKTVQDAKPKPESKAFEYMLQILGFFVSVLAAIMTWFQLRQGRQP